MKEIKLTHGYVAIVDDEDYEKLNKHKWHVNKYGDKYYASRTERVGLNKRKHIKMHRQILGISDSKMFCDHRNGNGLDNRRENLRQCTQAENTMNKRIAKNNTTGFKGVGLNKKTGKFKASIRLKRKLYHIGTYDTAIDAAMAYDNLAIKMYGEFACLNFENTLTPLLSSAAAGRD